MKGNEEGGERELERKERNEEESSGEEAILFEEVFLLTAHTFAESRHKLYVTKYHPLKQ